jgi:hypothetical protein
LAGIVAAQGGWSRQLEAALQSADERAWKRLRWAARPRKRPVRQTNDADAIHERIKVK